MTPILVDDPFLALGMTVNFPPWKPFFDFPFRSYSCFRKKIRLTCQKVFPLPTVGAPSASNSPSALLATTWHQAPPYWAKYHSSRVTGWKLALGISIPSNPQHTDKNISSCKPKSGAKKSEKSEICLQCVCTQELPLTVQSNQRLSQREAFPKSSTLID